MAGFRQVHTKMWADNWFSNLPPEHKLLFVYLFTNERASISGIYELPLRLISFETGLDNDIVLDGFNTFSLEEKAFYDQGAAVVWVLNLRKYHETGSPKVQTKIMTDIAAVPDCKLFDSYLETYGIDRVSIGQYKYKYTSSSISKSNYEGRLTQALTDTKPDQMIEVLAEVCGLDPYVRDVRDKLAGVQVQLTPRYKPEYVRKRYGEGGKWYDQKVGHWKGKKGQRPTLQDVTMTIGMGDFTQPDQLKAKSKNERKDRLEALWNDEMQADETEEELDY